MPVVQNGDVVQECVDFDRLQQPGVLKPGGFARGALAANSLHIPGPQLSTAACTAAGLRTGAGFA